MVGVRRMGGGWRVVGVIPSWVFRIGGGWRVYLSLQIEGMGIYRSEEIRVCCLSCFIVFGL